MPAYNGHLWPRFDPGFEGLVRIVLGQQVSIKAAHALWIRLNQTINPLTPENIIAAEIETLRGAGLSRQKIAYITGLAQAIAEERIAIAEFASFTDEKIISEVTALKGFGLWSAQMYLMFALARPDVWPSGDLGIQIGIKNYLSLEKKPDAIETEAMRHRFEPYCTAASLLLWHMNTKKQIVIPAKAGIV
jgi:DNA-3-methyladenine glycosylase II